jgi:hypothetical protein
MSSDKHSSTKDDLLRELESLRLQLENAKEDAKNGGALDDDIPILLDKVEQVVAAAPEDATPEATADDAAALQAAYHEAAEQTLTSEPAEEPEPPTKEATARSQADKASPASGHTAAPARPVARGENPFLPKHIRDRLNERRQALADDIAQAGSFFPSKPATSTRGTVSDTDDYETIVDELVAEYLPRLERDLRARLLKQVREARKPTDKDA